MLPAPDADGESPARHAVVVGGGISGLSAAEALLRSEAAARVTVLEASDRLGGTIRTERVDAMVVEHGPDLMVSTKPAGRALCARLGIADRLHGTSPAARGAYVVARGRLHRLPAGSGLAPATLAVLAASPLLSLGGKLRAAAEAWVPARAGDDAEESVAEFMTRRVGREMYERVTEPLLTGIYGGDGAALSVDATFPQLRAMERTHGGLRRAARATRGETSSASPFLSLPNGMQEIVDALAVALRASGRVDVRCGTRVRAIASSGRGVQIMTDDGGALLADAAIVALPAPAAAAVLGETDAELAAELSAIAYASTAIVSLAYARAEVPRALDATGYVVPRIEHRDAMACTWSSAKFANRAPADRALFRLFFGGARRPELAHADDAALVAHARRELREMVGVVAEPRFVRVTRHVCAMPQYVRGHRARIARIDARLTRHPRLALAGNAYDGVGIPDCIRSGERAAARVSEVMGATARCLTNRCAEAVHA